MKKVTTIAASLALAIALPIGTQAADKSPAAAKPQAKAEPAQQQVAYAELGKYVGKRIIVHSKLNTTRSGVLTRYSASEIDLKLDGGADLSMTADSIRSVSIPIAPADPLFPEKTGDGKPAAKATDAPPANTKPAPLPAAPKPADNKAAAAKTGEDSAKKK